jgi:hypothetical protein
LLVGHYTQHCGVTLLTGVAAPVSHWVGQAGGYVALSCREPIHNFRSYLQDTPREALRTPGIRTATDLKLAWGEEDPEEGSYASIGRHQLVEAVGGNKTGIARIEIVLQSFENDASFLHVQAFRRHDWLQNVVK